MRQALSSIKHALSDPVAIVCAVSYFTNTGLVLLAVVILFLAYRAIPPTIDFIGSPLFVASPVCPSDVLSLDLLFVSRKDTARVTVSEELRDGHTGERLDGDTAGEMEIMHIDHKGPQSQRWLVTVPDVQPGPYLINIAAGDGAQAQVHFEIGEGCK